MGSNTRIREQKAQGAGNRLPQTSWTLLAAVRGEGSDAAAAREEFVRRYYPPVHAYLAAIIRDAVGPVEPEELTQGFFSQAVATGRLLAGADRAKGSFRPYLKQALRNYVIDWQRKQARTPQPEVRPDADDGGGWERVITDVTPGPDTAFHAAWVRTLIEEALGKVQARCEAKGQQEHFALFVGRYLNESGEQPSWRDLGTEFNLDEKTARSRAETVARHFRLLLRETLAQDVGSGQNVDEEIAVLLAAL
jgi:RNA polymerase sigma factor (sigma-70 family)